MDKNLRQHVKNKLREECPNVDLTMYDKYFDVMARELYAWQKKQQRLCYNKKCDKRMF